MGPEDLTLLKYAELQKLAKNAGIRANQKVEKLIRALKEHYGNSSEEQTTDVNQVNESRIDEPEESAKSLDISECEPKEIEKTGSQSKKRRRTFELEEPTLKGDSTPVIESEKPRVTRLRTSRNTTPQSETTESQPVKRLRRDTYEKQSPLLQDKSAHKDGSPSTRAILDSIDGDCSSAERKERLLSAINKKVQSKMVSSPSNTMKNQPSQIPRFMAFLTNKKKDSQNSSTPGSKKWSKVHEKEFAKFDSIDVYLEKKQQRKENLSASAKKQLAKKCTAELTASKPVSKEQQNPKGFKPTVMSTKNINFEFSKTPKAKAKVAKPVLKELDSTKIFKPTTMSTKNINFDFSKTPKSKAVNTPSRKPVPTSTKHVGSTKRATPFKFTGNSNSLNTTEALSTSTVTSSKKSAFDLKASLAKPLTWKPHTGKLQQVNCNTKQNVPTSRSGANLTSQSRVRKVVNRNSVNKTRPVQAKNIRRAAQLDRRSNQKYVDMMKRRGLMA